jgi:UDPglucose 6-dehydrogenase
LDTTVIPVRLTVIGAGYLGLTHAVCMADLGHEVLAIDVDAQKIAQAASGEVPFFEPGLEPLLRKNVDTGRLRFSMSFAEAGEFGEAHFLCVGTPQASGGAADLSQLLSAAGTLAPHLAAPCLLVGKSTVPVGTARRVREQIRAVAPAGRGVDLAWNPEFLREGHAVQDSLAPNRFVFGVTSETAADLLRRIYAKPLAAGIPALAMDLETAEVVKVAANAFLATKISFINAMAEVCEAAGADVVRLAEALGYDERIGRTFLKPGLGFGGGCLPKDIRAFRATAAGLGMTSVASLLAVVDTINLDRRARVAALAREAAVGSLAGKRVAVLGAAFKPNSDDVRDSPSLDVCGRLSAEDAIVSVHDPVAMQNAAQSRPDLRYAASVSEAAEGADLILHLTEWADYQAIDPAALGAVVAQRTVIAGCSVRVLGQP